MENSQNFNKILKYRKYKMASIANEIKKFPPRKKFIELQKKLYFYSTKS